MSNTVLYASANGPPFVKKPSFNTSGFARRKPGKVCVLCKAAGRSFNNHYLSKCKFVPEADKRNMSWSRLVVKDRYMYVDLEEDTSEYDAHIRLTSFQMLSLTNHLSIE